MSGFVDLGGELSSVGIDNRKLYELDVDEAIERENNTRRNKDDVSKVSVGMIDEIVIGVDSMKNETGYSAVRVASGMLIHGASIIQRQYGDISKKLENDRCQLIDCSDVDIKRLASSSNSSTYNIAGHSIRRSVVLPQWVTGFVSDLHTTLFLDRTTLYQLCMIHSMLTKKNVSSGDKLGFVKHVSAFYTHIRTQCKLFGGLKYSLDNFDRKNFDDAVGFDQMLLDFGLDDLLENRVCMMDYLTR